MIVTYKMFTTLTIVLALVTVALFPFWPYSRWGYTPSLLLAVIVILMVMYHKLART